jgi:hypothetical protein
MTEMTLSASLANQLYVEFSAATAELSVCVQAAAIYPQRLSHSTAWSAAACVCHPAAASTLLNTNNWTSPFPLKR